MDSSTSSRKGTKKRSKKDKGFIKLRVYFDTSAGHLVAEVREARNLIKPGSPFVKIVLTSDPKATKQRTSQASSKTADPVWNEGFRWPLPADPREVKDDFMELTIWDKGTLKDSFLGRTAFQIGDVMPPNPAAEGWFSLLDADKGKTTNVLFEPDTSEGKICVALYDNEPRGDKELLMRKGDYVVELSAEGAWVLCKHCLTGQEGYVPNSFLAPYQSLESEPWFFGPITRAKAEKLLGNPMRKHGCFLIRESESSPGTYSLSMKDGDNVRHFRVKQVDGNKLKLQGSPSRPHDDLPSLVAYHKRKKGGLTTTLKDPCPREQPARAADLSYAAKDKWEVERESIELISQLGEGQYGEVYKGIWNGTTEVAVKTLKSKTTSPEEFLEEAQLMKKLRHDNLVSLYAVCTIGEPIFIITELCKNGSLLDYLRSPMGESLRLPTLVGMATDVAAGMAYLENNNYIHRDLAARNILVGESNVCKVADFGLARVVSDGQGYTPETLAKFPVRWTAPEAMTTNTYSIKSDVWSFGVLLAEIVTYGKKPYDGMTNKEVVKFLDQGKRMDCPPGCPDKLYKIMLNCWKTEPEERPHFEPLSFELEEFFHGDGEYADASKLMEDDDDK
eukprot:TRINITY_DN8761_c0_g1_i2.p1 TRINITY_DN8761_c0_g1~~TRINITY_DN8761_c0_g1_i2.p1  ORF type:complete len:617 (+),score=178.57 TRINITY_DN8761_c0_g1_i2:180-2030(+)